MISLNKFKKINKISLAKLMFVTLIIFSIFIIRCVAIKTPEGGEEEKDPPVVLKKESTKNKQYIYNGAVNVKGKKLIIEFNQRIDEVPKIEGELIIMPSLKIGPGKVGYKAKVSGKQLIIKLDNELEDKTAYTFNFRKAIKNLNEGVVAENLSVSFSTGPELSKLYLPGVIGDIMTGLPEKKLYVSIYKKGSHKNIFNSVPDYFTQANENGQFIIKYINPGEYTIYASDNINFTGKKDVELGIKIAGFIKKNIEVKENTENIIIPVLKKNLDNLRFLNAIPNKSFFEITLNKPIKNYTISLIDKPLKFQNMPVLYSNLSEKKDVIRVYNMVHDPIESRKHYLLEEDKPLDALLTVIDDLGNSIAKEIQIKFRDDDSDYEEVKLSLDPKDMNYIDPDGKLKIVFNKPIVSINTDLILITNELGRKFDLNKEDIIYNNQRTEVIIIPKLSDISAKELNIFIPSESIETADRDEVPNIKLKYIIKNSQNSGILKGKLGIVPAGSILQLLDREYKIVKEIRNKQDYKFTNVVPGNYFLRLFILRSPIDEWKSGDITKGIEPDPVLFYPGTIAINAGSELELKLPFA